MRKTTEHQQDEDSRLGQLETFTTRLGTQQEGFRYELHEVKKAVEGLAAEMRAFMSSNSRTNWSVLTGFGSLLLMISGLAAAPFYRDLGRLEARASDGERSIQAYAVEAAARNAGQAEKLEQMERAISILLEKVDVHSAAIERVNALEQKSNP